MHLVKVDENLRTDVIFDAPHGALSISQSLKTTGLLKDIKLGILDSNIIKIGTHLLWLSCKDICDNNFYTHVTPLLFDFFHTCSVFALNSRARTYVIQTAALAGTLYKQPHSLAHCLTGWTSIYEPDAIIELLPSQRKIYSASSRFICCSWKRKTNLTTRFSPGNALFSPISVR